MLTGLSNATDSISDIRKTAAINNELLRLQVDIAALRETRLAESRSLKESDYTFFWQRMKEEEQWQHDVGFAVRNTLLDEVQLGHQTTECLMLLAINTADGPINLLCAYALVASAEVKDAFYSQLDSLIQGISRRENLIILGDFNARVGSDNEAWPNCPGNFGVGKCNDNGQRLLKLCSFQELCVTNTFFCTKKHHRVSWRHPRSKHWHQLDLIITRRKFLQSFIITRTYHSADCDTDHSLVCCKVKLQPKKFYRTKQPRTAKVDVSKTRHPDIAATFSSTFDSLFDNAYGLPAAELWNNIKTATHSATISAFGKKKGQQNDWYTENSEKLDPFVQAKRKAL